MESCGFERIGSEVGRLWGLETVGLGSGSAYTGSLGASFKGSLKGISGRPLKATSLGFRVYILFVGAGRASAISGVRCVEDRLGK